MRVRTVALAAALVALAAAAHGNERRPGGGETHHDEEIVDDAGAFARPRRGRHDPVPNFGVIWERTLTRSGQPRSPEGWTWLRRQGVRSIVNFRTENDVDYAGVGFEHVLWLPFEASKPPKDADAERFLALVRDPDNWPAHIHCKGGRDRTGLMAALVRYAIDASRACAGGGEVVPRGGEPGPALRRVAPAVGRRPRARQPSSGDRQGR